EGWSVARIPLTDLGAASFGGIISGVAFLAASADKQADIFLDDITLQPARVIQPALTVSINVTAERHPISPYVYGMAWAPTEYLTDLHLGLNRWGGNPVSRYNWVHGNACNAARDWEWRNRWVLDSSIPPAPSSAADRFVAENRSAGTASLLT